MRRAAYLARDVLLDRPVAIKELVVAVTGGGVVCAGTDVGLYWVRAKSHDRHRRFVDYCADGWAFDASLDGRALDGV